MEVLQKLKTKTSTCSSNPQTRSISKRDGISARKNLPSRVLLVLVTTVKIASQKPGAVSHAVIPEVLR